MRISSLYPFILAVPLVLSGCQQGGSSKGGGGGSTGGDAGGGPGAAYTPADQPAVNPLASQGAPAAGGRVQRSEGGPNAGAYNPTPPEGARGSGSAYNAHEQAKAKRRQFDQERRRP